MRSTLKFLIVLAAAGCLCAQPPPQSGQRTDGRTFRPERDPDPGTLFQVSTLDALLQGVYQGAAPISQVRRYGDFGVGTVDSLDGELIILDGKFFQVTSDGIVHRPPEDSLLPFAAVTRFAPDIEMPVEQPATMAEINTLIEALRPSANYFYAVKVQGLFRSLTARSVPKQFPPFPPLADAIAQQSVFPFADIEGTAVCLVTPAFAAGINAGGLHCHFISSDETRGGHALDFILESGTFAIQTLRQHVTLLPEGEAFQQSTLPVAP